MGEEVIDEGISCLPVRAVVGGIVHFNSQHGHPVAGPAHQEIDMLLADGLESAGFFGVFNQIGEAGFADDMHPVPGKLRQHVKKTGFGSPQQGLGRILMSQGGEAGSGFGGD